MTGYAEVREGFFPVRKRFRICCQGISLRFVTNKNMVLGCPYHPALNSTRRRCAYSPQQNQGRNEKQPRNQRQSNQKPANHLRHHVDCQCHLSVPCTAEHRTMSNEGSGCLGSEGRFAVLSL